jgi:hypothetical protein
MKRSFICEWRKMNRKLLCNFMNFDLLWEQIMQ